jgi:hypothetical protein
MQNQYAEAKGKDHKVIYVDKTIHHFDPYRIWILQLRDDFNSATDEQYNKSIPETYKLQYLLSTHLHFSWPSADSGERERISSD